MLDHSVRDLLLRLHAPSSSAVNDHVLANALVRCAEAVEGCGIDCPLGALVLDSHPIGWFSAARRVLHQDSRAVDPVLLGAVVECAVHRRAGSACPLNPSG